MADKFVFPAHGQYLVIDQVPYRLIRTSRRELILHSAHFAEKLSQPAAFIRRPGMPHAGFLDRGHFVFVTAAPSAKTVTFTSVRPLSIKTLAAWFRFNLDGINEIGAEVLVSPP
jgi:hypothetical protein